MGKKKFFVLLEKSNALHSSEKKKNVDFKEKRRISLQSIKNSCAHELWYIYVCVMREGKITDSNESTRPYILKKSCREDKIEMLGEYEQLKAILSSFDRLLLLL